jgi:hypothetical protein
MADSPPIAPYLCYRIPARSRSKVSRVGNAVARFPRLAVVLVSLRVGIAGDEMIRAAQAKKVTALFTRITVYSAYLTEAAGASHQWCIRVTWGHENNHYSRPIKAAYFTPPIAAPPLLLRFAEISTTRLVTSTTPNILWLHGNWLATADA